MPQTIESPSRTLAFIEVRRVHKAALASGRAQLAALLGCDLPDQWPAFPEAFDPDSPDPATPEWPAYFFVSRERGLVVGNGGYCGAPRDGEIEIGYEVAPAFRRQGFATAAVAWLMARAFAAPVIQSVIAHTLAERNASNSVLIKSGMSFVGAYPNSEVGTIWRWRKART
jgi:RimJ/RimL family protein N-acetyltransferase